MNNTLFENSHALNIKGELKSLNRPFIMGIINITPDSFYDGGKFKDTDSVLITAKKMIVEGVDIIDIGGYSSRPGADEVTLKQEKSRVLPVIEAISRQFPEVLISIDTFRSEIAEASIEAGAHIVNDISGGDADQNMFNVVARFKVPYILMHMKGTPQNMQSQTNYDDLLGEITDYFERKVKQLRQLGIYDIIIDPGFGFAKTIDQNYEMLRKLNYFNILNCPILVGISRKSMIYKKLNSQPDDALHATSVLHTIALMNGAQILRVHDVKEAKEVIMLFQQVYS